MNVHFTIASFLALLSTIAGIILSLILLSFPKDKNTPNNILSALFICLSWTTLVGFAVETNSILYVPHLYRTSQLAILVFLPLTWLYVRSIVLKTGLSISDLVHAIPCLFFIIDYLPFFILSATKKNDLIREDLTSYFKSNDFDEGWLTPDGFYFYMRFVMMFFYIALQVRILYLLYARKTGSGRRYDSASRKWLYAFTGLQVFGFVPFMVRLESVDAQWLLVFAVVGFPTLFATFWLFLKPEILYGLHLPKEHEKVALGINNGVAIQSNGQPQFTSVPEKEFFELLYNHVAQNKKFLQHKYTINQLAAELNTPPHQISNFLNQHMNTSFNDFLNKFRVEYCMERIRHGDAQRFTLEALSFECGFNNRNSFTTAFKRLTGITPSDFMRHIGIEN
jgi:AraC-like DNA-binding protein